MTIYSLASPYSIKKNYPLLKKEKEEIELSRARLKQLPQKSQLALIIGPCSVHHYDAFLAYANKLKTLADAVSKHFMIICRCYIEKSRTSTGWKGFLYQPDLSQKPSISSGIVASRKILLELVKLGLPIALEIVDPMAYYYFDDLITWGCIGARSCTSLPHRLLASFAPFPIGFKNSIEGDIEAAINGMSVALSKQSCFTLDNEGKIASIETEGNLDLHLVLRGSKSSSNCDESTIHQVYNLLQQRKLPTNIIVDTSHDNSKKELERQIKNFSDLIRGKVFYDLPISGLMMESYLKKGAQHASSDADPEISITDPCLDFETTRALILEAYDLFEKKFSLKVDQTKHFAHSL